MVAAPSESSPQLQSEPTPTAPPPALARLHETPLTPVPAPPPPPQHTRLLTTLSRIAHVSVRDCVKEDGHRLFVVDAVSAVAVAVGGRALDTHAETKHHYYEFTNLRRDLFYHTEWGHRDDKRPCAYCTGVAAALAQAPTPPRLLKQLFQNEATMRTELAAFLNVALQLALQAKHGAPPSTRRWCDGREMVPLLVKQFLLGKDDDRDVDMSDAGLLSDSRRDVVYFASA